MVALAIAVAAIYGQVTVNDIVLARYTADAWRGRVYAVRYFLLFISAGVAIGMISLLHERGGFPMVLAVDAAIALAMCHRHASGARGPGHQHVESAANPAPQTGGMSFRTDGGIRSSTLTRMRFLTCATMRLRWHSFGSRQVAQAARRACPT